jgi:hypothetical protein
VLGRARQEVGVAVADRRDHRPGCVLHRLGDQRERVLVVLVDHDDGEVGILAGDQLGRLAYGDGERDHLVAERLECDAQAFERALVLIGDQNAQVRLHS